MRASFDVAFGDDSATATPATASEDFSGIPDAFGTPYLYWFVGSTERSRYEAAANKGTVSTDIPGNHSPMFAPDPDPTLTRIAQSHAVAALTLLGNV